MLFCCCCFCFLVKIDKFASCTVYSVPIVVVIHDHVLCLKQCFEILIFVVFSMFWMSLMFKTAWGIAFFLGSEYMTIISVVFFFLNWPYLMLLITKTNDNRIFWKIKLMPSTLEICHYHQYWLSRTKDMPNLRKKNLTILLSYTRLYFLFWCLITCLFACFKTIFWNAILFFFDF